MTEVAHANESNDSADQGQPLYSFSNLGVAGEANIPCEANQPHKRATPEADGEPAHLRNLEILLRALSFDQAVTAALSCAARQR